MAQIIVRLSIDADEYLRVYQGVAQEVIAISEDGRRVRFPAAILRPFVTHDGISGRFAIEFDEAGKFVAIRRV